METNKIILPTDFSVKSLELVRKVLNDASAPEPLSIVLLHGTYLSNSITDLLFFSKSKTINKLKTDEFNEACNLLKNKYPDKINSLHVDLIISDQKAYFNSFVKKLQITKIFIPNEGFLDFSKVNGFNTLTLLKNCGVSCSEIIFEPEANLNSVENGRFSNLLLSKLK